MFAPGWWTMTEHVGTGAIWLKRSLQFLMEDNSSYLGRFVPTVANWHVARRQPMQRAAASASVKKIQKIWAAYRRGAGELQVGQPGTQYATAHQLLA